MRPVEQLLDSVGTGWAIVSEWITQATQPIEILPANGSDAKQALWQTQVTTRSPMGAIIYETGGLLVDHGWLRILGSGHRRLPRSLPAWNKGKAFREFGDTSQFLLIADDAVGGFFLLNGGGLGDDIGSVYYLAPNSLNYEPLKLTYSQFIQFAFIGNLAKFYEGMRWESWQIDAKELKGDEVFSFYPPLWTREGRNIEDVTRKAVPIAEQYKLNLELRKQF